MSDEVRLVWPGKRAPSLPAVFELCRTAGSSASSDGQWTNRLVLGDNLGAMAALLPEFAGAFDLIYLDPPFFTRREMRARDAGIGTPAPTEMRFSDSWSDGPGSYLQWLLDRIAAAHALLSPRGSLYLHLSWHAAHYGRLLLDEVFGVERFQNEIAWCYREAINSRRRWNRKHDTLLFYSRGEEFTFHSDRVLEPYADSTVKKFRHQDAKGAYRLMGRGITDSPLRSKRDLAPEMETLFPDLTYRHYLGEGTLPVDYWNIDIENQASKVRTGYPTQKPEALLERILLASTNEGDLVGDFCCGSGTTLAVASRMARRWVGCDLEPAAIAVTGARLKSLGAAFSEYAAGAPAGPADA